MKQVHALKAVLLSALVSFVCLASAVNADDTEIFFGQSQDAFNTNPNVLFILDTSGSMGWYDEGIATSRMDRLKVAMRTLLRESSSYNVGLMGFSGTNRGGSIRYPIGDLESDSSNLCEDGICPDETVIVRPTSSIDDATQDDDTLEVTINAPTLVMAESVVDTSTTVVEYSPEVIGSALAVAVSAEIELGDGVTDTRAITTSARWFFNGVDTINNDRYAYRFEDVNIPKGATITSASLSFTHTNQDAQLGGLGAEIRLEVNPDADALPDGLNGLPTIAERLDEGKSTDSVVWLNVPPDNTGLTPIDTTQSSNNVATSPDLSDMINQIVVLPAWKSGNALSFILDAVDEYNPLASDVREFQGINAVESKRPVLNFTYSETIDNDLTTTQAVAVAHRDEITTQTTPVVVTRNLLNPSTRAFYADTGDALTANEPRKLAFRFEDIDIPEDAIIKSAKIILTGSPNTDLSPNTDWTTESGLINGGGLALGGTAEADEGGETESTDSVEDNVFGISISAEKTGTPAPYDSGFLSAPTRELTDAFYYWDNVEINPNQESSTVGLENVIAAVINSDTWAAGQHISLVLEAPSLYNNSPDNTVFFQTSTGNAKPKLEITWKANETTDSTLANSQTTAIRFPNVHIPPEAIIKSARLIFTADSASVGETELEISAEDTSNSLRLTSANNNIGERTRTLSRVTWNAEPWDIPNIEYYSPELKDVVQSIVNITDWCGGNPITMFLKKTGGSDSRHAISYDQNQVSAPTLEITYAPESVATGSYCSNSTLIASVSSSANDATQDINSDTIDLSSPTLDTINPDTGIKQVIGLRFPSIGVPKDAVIVSAALELTPDTDVYTPLTLELKAVSSIENPPFNDSTGLIVSAARPTYPTTVYGVTTPASADSTALQIDVATLLEQKITDENWVQGSSLVITAETLSEFAQSFYAFNGDETRAPRLIIDYQSEREQPGTLFRDNLVDIVDDMVAQSGTPIVGSYYEAAQYFLGKPIDYGLQRGSKGRRDRYHRVSHPGSYTNGIVNRTTSCQDSNLNASSCRWETIDPDGGLVPTYISPMESECQQNHIVLLSDGQASSNSAATKIKNMLGISSCTDTEGDMECGRELAAWMHNQDMSSTLDNVQNVTTHTIGFNLDDPVFLQNLASDGGGSFYEAQSSAELVNAFKNIFINVSKTDTSFVAPSATVSQSNRLKNREDIYYSLFKPEGTARWSGNLKRYRLAAEDGETADILDANGALAIDERTGRFFSDAQSYWSDVIDGDSVLLGGAAEKIETDGVPHTAREVYTYTGGTRDLKDRDNALLPENPNIDPAWLRLTTINSTDEYVSNLLNWAHGRDEFDSDGDGNTEEARAQMGDPMHSQPLLVNYAGDKSVVHVATNEGFLHAFDHNNGTENFAFIPKELLQNLRRNYENEATRNRPYGLDGGMTVWIQDENNNGVVDSGTDKAYLYFGMRRGGQQYYALDITDPNSPQYMWSIQGSSINEYDDDATATENSVTAIGDFEELGQTWSKPIKTKLYIDDEIRDVLIFGAGYGSNQDPIDTTATDPITGLDARQTRSQDNVGRGFFIVDATTGAHIWNTTQIRFPDMLYSVPSELRVIDINFDGLADQIYFGDMGGQVWRFDYNNDQSISELIGNRIKGDRIGLFAGDTPEDARRFYYPPDVALLSIQGSQQLSISIGSGWRAHPLDTDVEDRFYNIRMTQVYGAPVGEDGRVRYPAPLTETHTAMIELNDTDITRTANPADKGWYLPMRSGEKVLSSSITIDNKIIFTSYVPSADSGTCSAAVGSGSVYYLDAATGNPIVNLDTSDEEESSSSTDSTETDLTADDRRRQLSISGIPPEATILFPESAGGAGTSAKATAFAGRDKLDEVDIQSLKVKTFWQEHIEDNL